MMISPESTIALQLEIEKAIGFVKHGLRALQDLSMANDFYELPLLLLAVGSERLCKCILVLHHESTLGLFPSKKQLKDWGHDLNALVSEVLRTCYPDAYVAKPMVAEDKAFLENEPLFRSLLTVLTDYGKEGRYYDLDTVCGSKSATGSPVSAWQSLEMEVVKGDPALGALLREPAAGDKLYAQVKCALQARIERFVRALCRQFTLGPISAQGKRFKGAVADFLSLGDDALAKRDYREL